MTECVCECVSDKTMRSGAREQGDPVVKQFSRCNELLRRMMREERARFFLEPVDPGEQLYCKQRIVSPSLDLSEFDF